MEKLHPDGQIPPDVHLRSGPVRRHPLPQPGRVQVDALPRQAEDPGHEVPPVAEPELPLG